MTEPELGEGWAENKQPVAGDDGVVFYLKYLGFTLVDEVDDDESYGDGASTKAVQRIVAMVSFHSHSVVCSACSIPSSTPLPNSFHAILASSSWWCPFGKIIFQK